VRDVLAELHLGTQERVARGAVLRALVREPDRKLGHRLTSGATTPTRSESTQGGQRGYGNVAVGAVGTTRWNWRMSSWRLPAGRSDSMSAWRTPQPTRSSE